MTINFVRGDYHQIRFKFKSYSGSIDAMYLTVKCEQKIPRIRKKLGDGIELVDGWYVVTFEPKDTNEISCSLNLMYDIEIFVGDKPFTIMKDQFLLEEDITTPKEEV